MEKIVCVYVIQSGDDLVQDTFHAGTVQAPVGPGLHQLIEIAIHVFHANVQFFCRGIQEYVQSRDKMDVVRQRSQEDDLTELQTWSKRLERLLHRFYRNLDKRHQKRVAEFKGLAPLPCSLVWPRERQLFEHVPDVRFQSSRLRFP